MKAGAGASRLRILVVSDAWMPQVNGVVVTLRHTIHELERMGHVVETLVPTGFRSLPCPSYPEIRLSLFVRDEVARRIKAFAPDALHIATEGPLGLAARAHCLQTGRAFTTAYHTQFPEYVHSRLRVPLGMTYAWMRRFHAPAHTTMVPTPAVRDRLAARGFSHLALWSRGVDTALYRPGPHMTRGLQRPVFLYVGRLAVEKNLDAFLSLDLPGTKWVVGNGPARADLERRYPGATFMGSRSGHALAWYYRQADVFVFPSRTDTFGLVLLEAMASGTPVAAFPVTGPIDVVRHGVSGVLDHDLRAAALRALDLSREDARAHAEASSWARATEEFLQCLYAAGGPATASRRARSIARLPATGIDAADSETASSPATGTSCSSAAAQW